MIAFRTKPEEEEMIKAYAEQKGISVSDFLRETILERIKLDMTIVEAIVYTVEEFENILKSKEYQYDVSDEKIYNVLNEYYKSLKMIVNVKEVVVDNTKNKVVVIIN